MTFIPQQNLERAAKAIEKFGGTICEEGYRSALGHDPAPLVLLDVALAIAYCESSSVELTNLRSGQCSYALKHSCERWSAQTHYEPYVGNGSFIVAALSLNLPVKRLGLNARIGLRALPAEAWFNTQQQNNNSRAFT